MLVKNAPAEKINKYPCKYCGKPQGNSSKLISHQWKEHRDQKEKAVKAAQQRGAYSKNGRKRQPISANRISNNSNSVILAYLIAKRDMLNEVIEDIKRFQE